MKVESIALRNLAEVKSGGGAPQDQDAFGQSGYPFVRAGSLVKLIDGAGEESLERIQNNVAEKHGLQLFPAGTVLFAKSGMSATKGHIHWLKVPAYVVSHLAALIPRERSDSEFLMHALRRFPPTVLIKDAAYPSIRLSDIEDMEILAPSRPEERRRIAEVLDRAEALRAKRRAALAQLDTLTQAIFLDMFGDPLTNSKGWPKKLLGELITLGPQNGLYKPSNEYGDGTPILRIDAFYDGAVTKLDSLKRLRVTEKELTLFGLKEGEIVINRVNSREYLGKSALVPHLVEPIVFESNMMRFDIDRDAIEPVFLIQHLQTKFVRNHFLRCAKDAINQSSINQQDVKAVPIFVPPMSLQQDFTQRLMAKHKIEMGYRASLHEFDGLFSSLQDRAFRGML